MVGDGFRWLALTVLLCACSAARTPAVPPPKIVPPPPLSAPVAEPAVGRDAPVPALPLPPTQAEADAQLAAFDPGLEVERRALEADKQSLQLVSYQEVSMTGGPQIHVYLDAQLAIRAVTIVALNSDQDVNESFELYVRDGAVSCFRQRDFSGVVRAFCQGEGLEVTPAYPERSGSVLKIAPLQPEAIAGALAWGRGALSTIVDNARQLGGAPGVPCSVFHEELGSMAISVDVQVRPLTRLDVPKPLCRQLPRIEKANALIAR